MIRSTLALALALLFPGAPKPATADSHQDFFTADYADAQLLILGTFHFKDAGLDSYKPEVDVDILSEARQVEVNEVLDRLAAWKPTKILVECDYDEQSITDERYRQYLAGELELGANEVYQIGFRLARRLGLDGVHNVDASGRFYEGLPEDTAAYAAAKGQSELLESPWDERYEAYYRAQDHAKAGRSLRETLLALNDSETLRRMHGHYVLRSLALGDEDEYPSADFLTGWWYNRNLRILANVLRATERGDRVLLLIGAGHVPILRHAADASPELDLVEVREVLGAP